MLLTFCLELDSLTTRLLTLQLNLMRIWHSQEEGGEPLSNPSLYRRLVGSLVYLIVTRPDISYAVHQVSQYLSAPRSTHYAALLCILRYLKGTLFHGIFYSAQYLLVLRAFSDADWAGDPTDRRSTIGYCFLLSSSLISWWSKKHLSSFGYDGFLRIWVCPHPLLLPFIVTTRVPFILLIMISSINGLNTSRLIIILSVIILSMVLSSFSSSPPKINLQISSPSHFLRDALVIWLTTSSWSHIHLEFEGGC